jgi:hypothetical protein
MKCLDDYIEFWKNRYMEDYRRLNGEILEIKKNKEDLSDEELVLLRYRGYKVEKNSFPAYYRQVLFLNKNFGKDNRLAGLVKDGNWKEIEILVDKRLEKRKEEIMRKLEKKAGTLDELVLFNKNGELYGYVGEVGTKKRYRVQTATYGGHNVAALHFRLKFTRIK